MKTCCWNLFRFMTDEFPSLSTFGLDYSCGGVETKHSRSVSHVTAQDSVSLMRQEEVWCETETGSVMHDNSFVSVLIQREFPVNNAVWWMYFLEIGD